MSLLDKGSLMKHVLENVIKCIFPVSTFHQLSFSGWDDHFQPTKLHGILGANSIFPIPSMYGIFTDIWLIYGFHVGKYTVRPMDASWVLMGFSDSPFQNNTMDIRSPCTSHVATQRSKDLATSAFLRDSLPTKLFPAWVPKVA